MSDFAVPEQLPLIGDLPELKSGIWPAQWIAAAIERRDILAQDQIARDQIQPSSLDLRLGSFAYKVPASFLPGRDMTVKDKIDLLGEENINIENGAVLRKSEVYIVQLQESLRLKKRVSGSANPKSSTGRLDVFARVITDYGTEFDTIRERYVGPLWLEVAPRSFNVEVRRGSKLAQIRLRRGSPRSGDALLKRLNKEINIVHAEEVPADIKDNAIALSVDVRGDPVSRLIGYKAKQTDECIDIDKVNTYDVDAFWERIYRPERGGIILHTNDFHILATKESVAIPDTHAADMVAYDTLVGEFRAHYAGFFDPGFGYSADGPNGAKIVLEIRSHEVPFMLEHGQVVGRVVVERLAAATDRPYGADMGSSYQRQGLMLGKHFKR
jgi:dCTP deaminase